MVYTNPQAQSYLEEVENRGALDRHFDGVTISDKLRQGRFLLHLVSKYTAGRNLLDFGCGVGALVHLAREKGWQAVGYDLNSGLVAAANKHWRFGVLESGPLDEFYARHENSFDAIVSFQVFEHIQQPLEAGAKLLRLLRPGGVVLIDVPNVHQPGEWFARGRTLDPTSHWNHFSTRTLSDLVRRLGCEVLYASAAPSLVKIYHRLGFHELCVPLGVVTKSVLPPVGSGVCVIGRKRLQA